MLVHFSVQLTFRVPYKPFELTSFKIPEAGKYVLLQNILCNTVNQANVMCLITFSRRRMYLKLYFSLYTFHK